MCHAAGRFAQPPRVSFTPTMTCRFRGPPFIVFTIDLQQAHRTDTGMRIIIFGATGGIGRLLVEQALTQGHAVTAFVRDPAKLPQRAALRVVAGDLFDTDAVSDAIDGQRAVFSALGARSLKAESVLANALPNILHGMRLH